MTLELPADLYPFRTDRVEYTDPGCYAMQLEKPPDPETAWFERNDVRPDWLDAFLAAERVFYVGASQNVLRRLEQHRDGDIKTVDLVRICEIQGIETVLWNNDPMECNEYNLARDLRQQYPDAFVRQA